MRSGRCWALSDILRAGEKTRETLAVVNPSEDILGCDMQ